MIRELELCLLVALLKIEFEHGYITVFKPGISMYQLLIHYIYTIYPSRQILVPKTSRGRPCPTSPQRPLNILFDHNGDVPICCPEDVLI